MQARHLTRSSMGFISHRHWRAVPQRATVSATALLPGLLLSMTAFAPKPDGPLTRGRLRDEDGIGGCGAGRGGDDEPRGASRSGRRGANRLREVPGGAECTRSAAGPIGAVGLAEVSLGQ